jgi:hypothetical protein
MVAQYGSILRRWSFASGGRARSVTSTRGLWLGALVGAYLLLAGVSSAYADYIAEVKVGTYRGYLYIGKRMTKWQGSTDWSYGDLVLRDDTKTMYFIGLLKDRTRQPGSTGVPPPDAEARVAEARRQLESGGEVVSGAISRRPPPDEAQYETRVVYYAQVVARRQITYDRAIQMRNDILAHAENVSGAATIDIFVSGQPTWAKTGETEVIAGHECTKYHLIMAPVFAADVWMTEDFGRGYGAGEMFDKVFDLYRGGVRPLGRLGDIPGFPLKIKAQQRDVFSAGVSQFDYEVLKLTETDLDEKEFGPQVGSRVYEGQFPGME